MKIILKQDFELLGTTGEIKEVKSGYARNFLIPRGIAVIASASNVKSVEEVKRQKSRKTLKEVEHAKIVAGNLESNPITFFVKSAEEDKIYGSVTSQMIFDTLKEKGFDTIEKRKIVLSEPIRTLGEHIVDIKLHTNVVSKLKVIVEKEKTEEIAETVTENSEPQENEK